MPHARVSSAPSRSRRLGVATYLPVLVAVWCLGTASPLWGSSSSSSSSSDGGNVNINRNTGTYLVEALRHTFTAHREKSLVGPIGEPFGFLVGGHFELKVSKFELTVTKDGEEELDNPSDVLARAEAGFILRRFHNEASFIKHMDIWRTNSTLCAFDTLRTLTDPLDDDSLASAMVDDAYYPLDDGDDDNALLSGPTDATNGILLNPKLNGEEDDTVEYKFQAGEEGLYFLIYHVCPYSPYLESTFDLDFHFGNRVGTRERYLSAGLMPLPLIYLYFSVSYFLCGWIWYTNIRLIQQGQSGYFQHAGDNASARSRPVIYPIHQLMTFLLLLKFWSVLFESIRYHKINVSGHAELLSFFYYTISFVKGVFLFTVILLIGTGWSMVKSFLNDWEKKAIAAVLVLQVANNIAILALSTETEGESSYSVSTFVIHTIDIFCCCVVIFPIIWQVNQLEKRAGLDDAMADDELVPESSNASLDDNEAITQADSLSKLKLFRTFNLMVMGYLYSTRVLIYIFASLLDYRHLWIKDFVVELVTLAFYVSVGMLFHPVPELSSSYQSVAVTDETAKAAAQEIELSLTTTTDTHRAR